MVYGYFNQSFANSVIFNEANPSPATDINGSRGRKKKKLAINEAEAGIVRMAYDLYLHGHEGRVMGIKEIAKHFTATGLLNRGKPWNIQKVHQLSGIALALGGVL